jgi:ABC-type maltose transport system permease subunit
MSTFAIPHAIWARPPAALYHALRKYLVSGLAAGAVKA